MNATDAGREGELDLVYRLSGCTKPVLRFWPTTIIMKIEKETFKTTGAVVKELGWSAVDPPHGPLRKEKGRGLKEDSIEEDDILGLLSVIQKSHGQHECHFPQGR